MYKPNPHPEYTPRRFDIESKGGQGYVIMYERQDRQGYDVEVWSVNNQLIDAFRDRDYFHGLGRAVDTLYRPPAIAPRQPGMLTARDLYGQAQALRLAAIEAEVRDEMNRGGQ